MSLSVYETRMFLEQNVEKLRLSLNFAEVLHATCVLLALSPHTRHCVFEIYLCELWVLYFHASALNKP